MNGERKRANVFGEPDDDSNRNSPKRPKTNIKGTTTYLPPPESLTAPATPNVPANIAIDIAAKRAEIQAKLAAMRQAATGGAPTSLNTPSPPSAQTSIRPASPSVNSTATSVSGNKLPAVPGLPQPNLDPDLAKKVAEAKRLVESMQARKRGLAQPVNPYLSAAAAKQSQVVQDPSTAGRGGLNMAAHPLLSAQTEPEPVPNKKERYKPMLPKFSTAKANARLPSAPAKPSISTPSAPVPDLVDTPFYDPSLGNGSISATGRSHMGRGHARNTLKFNQRGKFVKLGESIRAEARMEDLKKRILESARKAGLESEMEDQARNIKRAAPPEIEWWDAPFLPEKSYDSFSEKFIQESGAVTIYVQHPIQIPAPSDKIKVQPKPLFLTKKEQKKMRRQRRMAELQDRQDRIKMGLLPPDPPKVKLSNMMRVLTQEAVLDPTKIENQVRREMVQREQNHLKANAERKLTADEKKQKYEQKAQQDEQKGIGAMCFKIRYLSNPSHKFKVKKTAVDDHLTGVICHNPRFCLVVVEGGSKGLKHYKKLMLDRIDWTEEVELREGQTLATISASGTVFGDAPVEGEEETAVPSLADNYCQLIWEGQHRERLFRDMRHANCPAEKNVKDVLGPKLEGLWDVAKVQLKEED